MTDIRRLSSVPLTFGSLFAGIGGFDLGFERAGMVCKWQVEIDDYASKVLARHWPDVHRARDIRECGRHNLEQVDVICGGDPCQANSRAGRSTQPALGDQFIRIVDALRPRVVVRENPTRVRKDAPWPWWRMRHELESLGYAVLPFRLRACCFGLFHQRDRLFLLGELADAHGDRLERGQAQTEGRESVQPSRRLYSEDWLAVSASRGLRSRTGFPNYVERMRGIGNAVVPQVAEWIGRRIVDVYQQ